MRVGFIGLGTMGTPMALNLARKFPITVWNRNPMKYPPLTAAGAKTAATPSDVARDSEVPALRGKTLINASSVPEEFSHYLAKEVSQAGGDFVEMPVSGSKGPAEQGQLVALLAGDADVVERIRPVVQPIASTAVYCGPIGYGLRTKYAVNLYLITLTVGLAESMNLARAQGIDLAVLEEVLNAGPMASVYTRTKMAKVISRDFSPQAAIKDCHNSGKLICAAAEASAVRSPLIQTCRAMYEEATKVGFGEEDMIAVIKLLSSQSSPD
ncbi:hypothetical protein O1611_g9600 [Lasiodiplodia mahajangana]|uniref:Uncharacterized protein n=1 Tax=Lasiodiplodia mahajangana TaxID=1108764 RepID=A0ACC2J7S3_9PEZI|nr:hypothetical protein O1611_g9600 [Lasiodiplodia mahajangana]